MIRTLRQSPQVLVSPVPPQGHPDLRTVLARRALANGINATPDDVIVTHGCIEALNLALRAVARPGDTIAVESPTYFGLLQILESLGMRALEIPTSRSTACPSRRWTWPSRRTATSARSWSYPTSRTRWAASCPMPKRPASWRYASASRCR